MFGRKQLRIQSLEDKLNDLSIRIVDVEHQRDALATELREMDNKVFAMANAPNWELMRPHFAEMSEATMSRKTIESRRINTLICNELNKKALR